MIEIEEPPTDQRACSTCMSPLTWIYVHHLSRNVAVVPVPGVAPLVECEDPRSTS